jgi:hypothetical protein
VSKLLEGGWNGTDGEDPMAFDEVTSSEQHNNNNNNQSKERKEGRKRCNEAKTCVC